MWSWAWHVTVVYRVDYALLVNEQPIALFTTKDVERNPHEGPKADGEYRKHQVEFLIDGPALDNYGEYVGREFDPVALDDACPNCGQQQ